LAQEIVVLHARRSADNHAVAHAPDIRRVLLPAGEIAAVEERLGLAVRGCEGRGEKQDGRE
jgi:hypothetical protein